MKTSIILLLLCSAILILSCSSILWAADDFKPVYPKTQIFKLDFGEITTTTEKGQTHLNIPWIADFIKAFFVFFIGAIAIIAAVMIMWGGFLWLTAGGNPNQIGVARTRILNALLGLVLALSSYLILNTVNPTLVKLKGIKLGGIDPIYQELAKAGYEGDGKSLDVFTARNFWKNLDQNQTIEYSCPKSGGIEAIPKVARSFKNKVTYSQTYREAKRMNNTIFLDCSSYMVAIYYCVGLPNPGSTTDAMFGKAAQAWPAQVKTLDDYKKENLKTGDLLGWPPKGGRGGHVVMYIGDNRVIEVHGCGCKDDPPDCCFEKAPGDAVREFSLDEFINERSKSPGIFVNPK